MDRYVIREPRAGVDYQQGKQIMTLSSNGGGSNMIAPENSYYEGNQNEYSNPMRVVPSTSFMGALPINASTFNPYMVPCQGQMMSGIDPRYLASYSDTSGYYIATGQPNHKEVNPMATNIRFGNDYQNRSFTGLEKQQNKIYQQAMTKSYGIPKPEAILKAALSTDHDKKVQENLHTQLAKLEQLHQKPNAPVTKPIEVQKPDKTDASKESKNLIQLRSEKLTALYKSGPRVFSGPVEKVLKWHKSLQDIGVFVFYEIVGKCVNVRPGPSYAQNLVVRDDNGPAMQVVYYEIDFLLPELKPPCVVRVIGRMMPGTCRLQAFSVRPAKSDDVATLSRRAAVATHHVTRLCVEYGISS